MLRISHVSTLAIILAFGSVAAFARSGQDTFTVSATLVSGLGVECGSSLSFGSIARGATYAGGGTVTISATASATPSTSDPQLILAGGSALSCTVTGATNNALSSFVLSGGGGTASGSTLTGVTLTGATASNQTLSADLTAALGSGVDVAVVVIGGTLTVKAGGETSDSTKASAQVYTSTPITLTVTE